MQAIIVGPDRGMEAALEGQGVSTVRIDGIATGDALDAAGVDDADLLVITDVGEATAVPIAKDRTPGLRTVFYTPDAVPEFVRGQLDFAIDPALLGPDVVAEELAGATVEGRSSD